MFPTEGISTDMISAGEPRLRRSSRTADDSFVARAGAVVRRLRPSAPRVPVLGR